MSPRGRWSLVAGTDILTHISADTLVHFIVYALLMHTQTRSESNENREIPSKITTCTVCPLLGINRHNKSTIVCKCSDNLFQTNVYLYRSHTHALTHTHARTHARAHTHDKKHGVRLRWVARRRTRSPGWRDELAGR